jgi:tetratricopeptide (TPR) repeat protein
MKPKKLLLPILAGIICISCKQSIKEMFVEADSYYKADQYTKAIKIYNGIIKRDSTIQLAYYYRGKCFFYLERDKEALADFNKIILSQPVPNGLTLRMNRNSPFLSDKERYKVYYEEALFERALTEYYMDSLKKAFADFRDCISLDYEPKSECYKYLGIIYMAYSKKTEGCEMLKKARMSGNYQVDELIRKYCQ